MHTAPAAAGSIGWVCTAAGTPGTEGLDAINAKLAEWMVSVSTSQDAAAGEVDRHEHAEHQHVADCAPCASGADEHAEARGDQKRDSERE